MSDALSQTKDLKNRIIFTIIILSIYRLGTFIPIPGIDPQSLHSVTEKYRPPEKLHQ